MGTSCSVIVLAMATWDHPHAYGDKRQVACEKINKMGSSPRVWGQEKKKPRTNQGFGIIPTRMGTRVRNKLKTTADGDHPHAYGDKNTMPKIVFADQGSSPRVWGQAIFSIKLDTPLRIIPTRMGTSLASIPQVLTKKDHPHAYGDKKSPVLFS